MPQRKTFAVFHSLGFTGSVFPSEYNHHVSYVGKCVPQRAIVIDAFVIYRGVHT